MPLIENLCIIGVGLIGGSVGKAVRERRIASRVVGLVRRREAIEEALGAGAVDRATLDPAEAVDGADCVVIATPVGGIEAAVMEVKRYACRNCVVTDTGSTKAQVVASVEAALGGELPFVGGHPIAGSEKRGVAHAKSDLFDGRPCIITVTERSEPEAVRLVESLWRAVGAVVSRMSPPEHDEIMARVSHFPHLAAALLLTSLARAPGGPERMMPYAGSGFRDTTRIAAGTPELWVDICLSNRAAIEAALGEFEAELRRAREALQEEDARGLRDILGEARELRKGLSGAEDSR